MVHQLTLARRRESNGAERRLEAGQNFRLMRACSAEILTRCREANTDSDLGCERGIIYV